MLHVYLELSYTFDHIWTNLLSAPSCQFLFSAVFVFQVFRPLKVLQKFRKNYIKNQHPGSLRNHQGRRGGPPQGLQKGPWRGPTLGRARHPPGCPVAPLGAPFAYIYPPTRKPPISIYLTRSPLCTAATAVLRLGLPGEAARHPAGRRNPLRETIHSHGRLPDVL